jgi:hypothetical protein
MKHLYNTAVYELDDDDIQMIWKDAPSGAVRPTEEKIMSMSHEEIGQLEESLKKRYVFPRRLTETRLALLRHRENIVSKHPTKPARAELHWHRCDDPIEGFCTCGQGSFLLLDYAGEPIPKPKKKAKK